MIYGLARPKEIAGAFQGGIENSLLPQLVQRSGIVLNLAFVYAALKLGFSIGGSTVASIMGYALLRGVLKKGTSIENNINQTIASGINTAGTGIVYDVGTFCRC